ncbi:MAG: ATP-binding protein [Balneolaceae bacterium]
MLSHYPGWAQTLAKTYLSRSLNQFILHGNVHDLVPVRGGKGDEFVRLQHFLADDFFAGRDAVIFYDRASGIGFRDQKTKADFYQAVSGRDTIAGTDIAKKIPKDPVGAFYVLEQYFRSRLDQKKRVALIINYAETVVPMNQAGSAGSDDRNALVYLLKWAHDPMFLAGDFTTILISEKKPDLHHTLLQNPYTADIQIPLPNEAQRLAYLNHEKETPKLLAENLPVNVVAQMTAGLGFTKIRNILQHAREHGETIDFESLSITKKEMIEAEAHGLLEFVQTRNTLDDVAGHHHVKRHLRQAVLALKNGHREVLPMGYLVCGPVGTGKTFLVNCFAGEVGIPMVRLKNFRSQWQGVTESNLEKILHLLQAMSPIAVMIDEADAYLGNRNASGDSGVSSRVFSQIATFMSNSENRGRILWFLMTARPDLMPVDLKRQGRAEEHLALLPPQTTDERRELFEAMVKKTGIALEGEAVPAAVLKGTYSGADMEAALTRAAFRAAADGNEVVSAGLLDEVFADFRSPSYPEEIELQTLAAVSECTSASMLPEKYATMNREKVLKRIAELKQTVR